MHLECLGIETTAIYEVILKMLMYPHSSHLDVCRGTREEMQYHSAVAKERNMLDAVMHLSACDAGQDQAQEEHIITAVLKALQVLGHPRAQTESIGKIGSVNGSRI